MAVNTVIPYATYISIADKFDLCRQQMTDNRYYLLQSVNEIINLTGATALRPEIDLINPFWNVYSQSGTTLESMAYFLEAVKALNQHVVNYFTYTATTTAATALSEYIVGGLGGTYPAIEESHRVIGFYWNEMSVAAGFSFDALLIKPSTSYYTLRNG